MSQLSEGLYVGASRVVRWMWSHPQRAVRLPMHVGGITAQRTDEPYNASILGCSRIHLELMAAATDTPDKEFLPNRYFVWTGSSLRRFG